MLHAAHVDEVLPQELLVLPVRQLVLLAVSAPGVMNPFPEVQVAGEFAPVVIEFCVLLVGLGLGVHGPVAHILDRQRGGDDQHFVQRATLAAFDDHAAHPRIERQLCQLGTGGRELVGVIHCAQFIEQLIAVRDGAARRRLDKRKCLDAAQVQRLHSQDHARER